MPNQAVTQPEPRYTLQDAAKHLHMRDRALFAALRRRKIIDGRNMPNWRWKEAGYFVTGEGSYKHPAVGLRFYTRTFVTPTGLAWLRDQLRETAADGTHQERTNRLLREIAHLNPDAGEIGPGKLRHIVSEARAVMGTSEVSA